MENNTGTGNMPEALQYDMVDLPDALNAQIDNYSFKTEWWGVVSPQAWANSPHAHNGMEIAYVTEGEGEFIVGGVATPVKRGSVMLAMSGEVHMVRSVPGSLLGIYFISYILMLEKNKGSDLAGIGKLFRKFLGLIGGARQEGPDGNIGFIFGVIRRSLEGRFLGWRESAQAASRALIMEVASLFTPGDGPVPETAPVGHLAWIDWSNKTVPKEAIPYRLSDWIIRNYRRDVHIEDAARGIKVSVRSVQRALEARGHTFRFLLHRIRLYKACHLLVTTNMPVQEVAFDVGFAQAGYFSRIFREVYGESPLKYRMMRGEKGPGVNR